MRYEIRQTSPFAEVHVNAGRGRCPCDVDVLDNVGVVEAREYQVLSLGGCPVLVVALETDRLASKHLHYPGQLRSL